MNNESNIRCDQHRVCTLHVHLIFATKYRRRVFDAQAIDVLRGIFANVCPDAHATLVQMDGEDDPVHLLVEYPPKVAVASLVNSLGDVSSTALTCARATGKACSGRPATLLPPAAERPSASCANT
jgi:putative transposase